MQHVAIYSTINHFFSSTGEPVKGNKHWEHYLKKGRWIKKKQQQTMAGRLPQWVHSAMSQSPQGDEKPSGSSNSHFTDQDEEEKGWMLWSRCHSNAHSRNSNLSSQSRKVRKKTQYFFSPSYPSEMRACIKTETVWRRACRLFKYFIHQGHTQQNILSMNQSCMFVAVHLL